MDGHMALRPRNWLEQIRRRKTSRLLYFKQTFAAVSWSPRESRTHTNSDISPHWRTASQGNVRIHALLRLCHKTPQAIAAAPLGFRCRRRIDSDFIDLTSADGGGTQSEDGDDGKGNSASAQFPHKSPKWPRLKSRLESKNGRFHQEERIGTEVEWRRSNITKRMETMNFGYRARAPTL